MKRDSTTVQRIVFSKSLQNSVKELLMRLVDGEHLSCQQMSLGSIIILKIEFDV